MLGYKDDAQLKIDQLHFKVLSLHNLYYEDTVTVTSKGLDINNLQLY